MKITALDCAILGLMSKSPRSGYAIRKVFEETALGKYSSSPGSIYPALAKLEQNNLLKRASRKTQTSRQGSIYRITKTGDRYLDAWLMKELTHEDIAKRIDEQLLKFAFMDRLDPNLILDFLLQISSLASTYIKDLESYDESTTEDSTFISLLAVENGIAIYKAHAKWATQSAEKIRANAKG